MTLLALIISLTLFTGILAILLMPTSIRFDSTERLVRVGWSTFSVTIKPGSKARAAKGKPKKRIEKLLQTLGRLSMRDPRLLLAILRTAGRSVNDLARSITVREFEADLSLPDPLSNGVLWGILAGLPVKRVTLRVNFQNINRVRGHVQASPYRLLAVAGCFLVRLPHRRVIGTLTRLRREQRKEETP